jgi:hypothetical protein
LAKTDEGFVPRPPEELQDLFDSTFDRPLDCARLSRGLHSIACALNEGDVARAMMATLFLHLPVLSEEEAARAEHAVQMAKAAADDPKHPGWPKGSPDSLGGKYRPKDIGELGEEAKELIEGRVRRLIVRRAIRLALKRLLNWRRLLRLGGEAASNAVPGLDVVGDAALIYDIASLAQDAAELRTETQVAEEFANKGPYTLDDLRVSQTDQTFPSYAAFTKIDLVKRFGPAGPGMEYHHIVEQSAEGDIPASEINSTGNIIRIPKLLHEEINSEYSRIPEDAAERVNLRNSLNGASMETRRAAGLAVLSRLGILE